MFKLKEFYILIFINVIISTLRLRLILVNLIQQRGTDEILLIIRHLMWQGVLNLVNFFGYLVLLGGSVRGEAW